MPSTSLPTTLVLKQFSDAQSADEGSPLTQRESQVLCLVASGASSPVVAAELNISKYTVEDHLKQIYRKLNI
jgi:ATP/maltotriose-dependent transcriptional regulator MalT